MCINQLQRAFAKGSSIFGAVVGRSVKNRRKSPALDRCADYSAGYGGPLVAYRFDGEQILNPDKFVAVE
jgi:hypothetical protein